MITYRWTSSAIYTKQKNSIQGLLLLRGYMGRPFLIRAAAEYTSMTCKNYFNAYKDFTTYMVAFFENVTSDEILNFTNLYFKEEYGMYMPGKYNSNLAYVYNKYSKAKCNCA